MNQPKFIDLNGDLITSLKYVTNINVHIFKGVLDSGTAALELTIDGEVIDTSVENQFIYFDTDHSTFTIPNLSVMPEGLILPRNAATRITLIAVGTVPSDRSIPSIIDIDVKGDEDFELNYLPPTGVVVERMSDSVVLKWNQEPKDNIKGYNVYASTQVGGGNAGYLRINRDIISYTDAYEEIKSEKNVESSEYDLYIPPEQLFTNNARITIEVTDQNGNPSASVPIAYRLPYTFGLSNNYKARMSFSEVTIQKSMKFEHNRYGNLSGGFLNADTFNFIPIESPLHYVVTTIYSNKNQDLVESRYSSEVSGAPLPLNNDIRGIDIRDTNTVVSDYIREITKTNPELSLIPGSTIREVHIEPFANEIQKAYFLMDFIHRANSFTALLAIDDPTKSGTSVPVSSSTYKTALKSALNVRDDGAVQFLINSSFDNLAANLGVTRDSARSAQVLQTFFTYDRPKRDLVVNANTYVVASGNPNSPRFISRGSAIMSYTNIDSYYNPAKRRYEMKVQMISEYPGSYGNLPVGSLDRAFGGASGLETINDVSAVGGRDVGSNLALAESSMRALSSVDTGTKNGLAKLIGSIPTILDFNVVDSGNEYMQRDYVKEKKEHAGGKVDIYIKGNSTRTVTEVFSFGYLVAQDVRFVILEINTDGMTVQAIDETLDENNPIDKLLELKIRDTGELINIGIPIYTSSPDIVVINGNFNNLPFDTGLIGTYRYRSNPTYITKYQPIMSVLSLTGEISGEMSEGTNFILHEGEDPTLYGYSTKATDHIEIFTVDDIPSGDKTSQSEEHILIGEINEYLFKVGADPTSISVQNLITSTIYEKDVDYVIIPGDQRTPIAIQRLGDKIISGTKVIIDYQCDENFTITYSVNDALQNAQELVNESKHVTADILMKTAVENPLSIEAVVQLLPNVNKDTVDQTIRSNYSRIIGNKGIGEDVHVSDIIACIDNVPGVDFVVQPFSKMTLKDGSLRVREPIDSVYRKIGSLSNDQMSVYAFIESLDFKTVKRGAPLNRFSAVYKNGVPLASAYETAKNLVGTVDHYFITSEYGEEIIDLNDQRMVLGPNVVLVSLSNYPLENPGVSTWSVSYEVNKDSGVKDIYVSDTEYLSPGDLTITYRQA